MNTKDFILLMIILISTIYTIPCSEGCLKCISEGPEDTSYCLLCDSTFGYYPSDDGSCKKKKIANCQIASSNFQNLSCFKCEEGYSLHNPSSSCQKIPNKKLTPYCVHYHWDLSCLECEKGYFQSNGICEKVPIEINKCEIYQSPDDCLKCSEGLYFDHNSLKCIPYHQIQNCKIYSQFECSTCMKNFFKVNNFLIEAEIEEDQYQYLLQNLFIWNSGPIVERSHINKCVRGSITYCSEFETFKKCKKCYNGYYLSIYGTCLPSPQLKIPFCTVYSDRETCVKCKENFYLKKNKCYEIDDNQNQDCLLFDDFSDKCLKCNYETHYLNENNCGQRIYSKNIEYCEQLSKDSDECLRCIPSFQLTDNKLKCLPHIAHCISYLRSTDPTDKEFTNLNTFNLKCEECSDHFYLSSDSSECLPQIASNCQVFIPNSSDCDVCADGYFKSGNECVKYTVNTCEEFNPNEDSCNTCIKNHFKNLNNICVPYSLQNCKEYQLNADACSSCFEQFYSDNGVCKPYTSLYCKTYNLNDDNCSSCYSDFYLKLSESNSCIPATSLNCVVLNNTNGLCSQCRTGYYLLNNICHLNTSTNCKAKSTSENKCEECEDGFFKNNETGLCVARMKKNCLTVKEGVDECESCNSNFYLTSKKTCEPLSFQNCQVPNNSNNTCVTCKNGFKKNDLTNLCDKVHVSGCKTYNQDACVECHLGLLFLNQKCRPERHVYCSAFDTDDKCTNCVKGYILDNDECIPLVIENCAVPDLNDNTMTSCITCSHGFYLESPTSCKQQDIENCAIYISNVNECSSCYVGFDLVDSTTCSSVTPLQGCITLNSTDDSLCSTCQYGYLLNTSTQLCELISSISDCIEYYQNSQQCKTCKSGMKPASDQLSCKSFTAVNNCKIHDNQTFECSECVGGYFLKEDLTCEIQNSPNCQVYIPNTNYCARCESNYILNNSECIQLNNYIDYCLALNSIWNCIICEQGYYPSLSNFEELCLKQDVEGCLQYFPNSQYCSFCDENYRLEDGECILLNFSNYVSLNDDNSEIEYCLPGYFISNNNCIPFGSSDYTHDSECLANTTTDLNSCSVCPFGTSSIELSPFKILNIEGCMTYDTTNEKCTECTNGYNFDGSTGTCSKYNGTDRICVKNSADLTEEATLDDFDKCDTCVIGYEKNSDGECVEATQCEGGATEQEFPDPSAAPGPLYQCQPTPDGLEAAVPNCLVYNADFTKCEICSIDFYPDNNDVCQDVEDVEYLRSINEYRLMKREFITENSGATRYYHGVDINASDSAISCSYGYKLSFDNTISKGLIPIFPSNIDLDSSILKFVDFVPVFQNSQNCNNTLVVEADGYKDTNDEYYPIYKDISFDEATFKNDCIRWENSKDNKHYVCVSCRLETFPKYRYFINTVTDYKSGGAIECVPDDSFDKLYDLERKYKGFGIQSIELFDYLFYINHDHCTNDNEALIAFLGISGDKYVFLPSLKNGNIHEAYACVPLDDTSYFDTILDPAITKYNLPGGIEFCQVNFRQITSKDEEISGIFNSSASLGDGSVFKCIACKPGYHPFNEYDGTSYATIDEYYDDSSNHVGVITSCTEISNCNRSGENNWLNSCETCSDGYQWEYDANLERILYHKCKADGNFPNCLASDDTSCKICKFGYSINLNGDCVSIAQDPLCNSPSLGSWSFNRFTDKNQYDYSFIHFLFVDNNVMTPYCSECADGYSLISTEDIDRSVTTTACSSNIYFSNVSNVEFCSVDDTNDPSKCSLCQTGYIIITNDSSSSVGSCTLLDGSFTVTDNCIAIETTTNTDCLACSSSLVLTDTDDGKICQSNDFLPLECNKYDATEEVCEICNIGYKVDENVLIDCKPVEASDNCIQETYDGRCLKCKDSLIPFNTKLGTADGRKEYSYNCETVSDPSLYTSFIGLTFGYDETTNEFYMESSSVPVDYHASSSISDDLPSGIIDVCFPDYLSLVQENCFDYDFVNSSCLKCNPGYLLNSLNECESFAPSNCASQNYFGFCTRCDDGFTINDDQTDCISSETSPISNCKILSSNNTSCLLCEENYYWDNTECVPYTNTHNCLNLDPYDNACLQCYPSYYLNVHQSCTRNYASNCLITGNIQGECLYCEPGFYLLNGFCRQSSQTPNCSKINSYGVCIECAGGYQLRQFEPTCEPILINKIEGCQTYDAIGFSCIGCVPPFKLLGTKCVISNISNCLVTHDDYPICVICQDGFYNSNGQCTVRTVNNCANYLSTFDGCSSCYSGMYLENKECKEYTVKNCSVMNPIKNACLTCEKNYYLFNDTCLRQFANNCKKFNPFTNKCSLCNNKFFLNKNLKCIPTSDMNCEINEPFSDICIKCKDGFFLEDTIFSIPINRSIKCSPYTVTNCEIFSPYADKCLVCKEYNILSPTGICLPYQTDTCMELSADINVCNVCYENSFLFNGKCYNYTVSNCQSYSDNSDKCLSCKKGFYLSDKTCLKNTSIGCEILDSQSNGCIYCKNGYYLENKFCQPNTSSNCQIQSRESNVCLKCKDKNYLMNGQCIPHLVICDKYHPYMNGCLTCLPKTYYDVKNRLCIPYSVKNCSTYNSHNNACNSCVDNYYLKNGVCYPYTVTDCALYHPLYDECIGCKENFYQHAKKCLKYSVDNCRLYSKVSDICLSCKDNYYHNNEGNCIPYTLENCETKSLYMNSCLKCKTNYYLTNTPKSNEGVCQKLTKVENCEAYSPSSNSCIRCKSEYFLVMDENKCIESKIMINHCYDYLNESNCKQCDPGYFVYDGQCIKSKSIIPNCLIYKNKAICSQCEKNYILSKNRKNCLKIEEQSCKTYVDPFNCKTCSDEKVLNYIDDANFQIISGLSNQEIKNKNKRAVCVDSGIPHCIFAREKKPNNICLKCASGYYVGPNNTCVEVINIVDGCEIYYNDGICAECYPNKVLSADKSSCKTDLSLVGPNCKEGKIYPEPKCFMCNLGYYLDRFTNSCEACQMLGCAVCAEPTTCSLCLSGFYMNESQKCIRGDSLSTVDIKAIFDTGIDRFSFRIGSVNIHQMNILLLGVISFLFKFTHN